MRSVLDDVAEALLWPLGITRRRRGRLQPREEQGDWAEEEDGWEVDSCHLLGAVTGAMLAWWALGRLKSIGPAGSAAASTPGPESQPGPIASRVPLSEFLRLLRAGAVSAVTFLADRPPAGALVFKALPAAAATLPAALPLVVPKAVPGGPQSPCLGETLLLPGCHQSLFEELFACKSLRLECAEVGDDETDMSKLALLVDVGGLLASIAALAYMLRSNGPGGGLFTGKNLEDSSAGADSRPAVTFEDVAGMENTKEELREVISFLRNPNSFYALGARPPRGILLHGPSGTGKTLLARAVAGEAGVPFMYASSASFVEIFVGQGAQRIRQFFDQARGCAPCIVFLDELDAVGTTRSAASAGGNQEYAQTLNQLLLELDGVESHSAAQADPAMNIVVTMAATNRYDCLDEALVRPGRLDRIVLVGLPNFTERVATLKIHSSRLRTDGLDFDEIATRTEGCSGADLANVLNEAALLAARRQADAVGMLHVNEILRVPRQQQRPQPDSGAPRGVPDLSQAGTVDELLGRSLMAAFSALTSAGRAHDSSEGAESWRFSQDVGGAD